mmetsp:Transcript_25398/g.49225  ORF Transcript_25398/g.49225 Transcript_25398/m.49225 type:complete len:116 (+) Transcript_25398:1-348(+)
MLGARVRVAASLASQASVQLTGAAPRSSTSASASNSLEDVMNAKYGSSVAKTLLLVLRGYDAYHDWWKTLDLMTTDDDENRKKQTALRMVIEGVGTCGSSRRQSCRLAELGANTL